VALILIKGKGRPFGLPFEFCFQGADLVTRTAITSTAATSATTTAAAATTATAASAAEAATATATTTAAKSTTATARSTVGFRACFVHGQRASVHLLAIEAGDRCFCFRIVAHFDECKTARLSAVTVTHDIDGVHLPKLAE
jgi:hypothetical protein